MGAVLEKFCEDSMTGYVSQGSRCQMKGLSLLSCHPAPEFVGLFSDAPSTGEVAELPHVSAVVREGKGVLVIIQI